MGYKGKYLPLKNYLESVKQPQVELSYEDIESILDTELPPSAYIYRPWWSNNGMYHSYSWKEAGWKVKNVVIGEKIIFKKEEAFKSKDIILLKNNERMELNEERKNDMDKDFNCSLEELKQGIISITQQSGCVIRPDQISIFDRGKPHNSGGLNGNMGVYIFIWKGEFLKIGKANFNSDARFRSQHYSPHGSNSNLSKSILDDSDMKKLGLSSGIVGDWIKKNTRRVDIFLDKSLGFFVLNFVEAFLHLKYKPKYEGFENQREVNL
jgi:hypothetical protein